MANPVIKIKRGATAPVSLSAGELAIDITNKNFYVGDNSSVPFAIGGEGTFATKAYADGIVATANSTLSQAIADEEARAIAAEGTLTTNLAAEVTRATTAEGVNAAAITQEISDRTSADTTLQSNIDVEKGRIDAILSAADADKDSFAEIVTLINSVDTTNDQAFAAYVLSNDAALAQEVSDRTAGDSALDSRVTALETTIDGGTY